MRKLISLLLLCSLMISTLSACKNNGNNNGEGGEEIELSEQVRLSAKGCIDNMIKYSK